MTESKKELKDQMEDAKTNAPAEIGPQLSFDGLLVDGEADADETTAITEVEEQQAIISLGNYSNAPDLDSEDVFIPRLRLAQGLTTEVQSGEAKPGQWIVTGYPAMDELTIIPLLFNRHRELTDDDFKVLCHSTNGVTGEGIPGGDCAACPMNQWTDGPKDRRVPPKCTFSYSYIVYVDEVHTIAMVDFKRTSIQAGKTLNTMVIQRGLGNFAATMKSTSKSGARGAYSIAVVSPTTTTPENLAFARSMLG